MQKLTIFTTNLQFSNAEMCGQEANFRMRRKVQRRAYQVLMVGSEGRRTATVLVVKVNVQTEHASEASNSHRQKHCNMK